MTERRETHVVTCFLRADCDVLLLRRSSEVRTYPGCWSAVSGYAEGDPDRAAHREIREETGITDAVLVRKGPAFRVTDDELGRTWVVHPYLFETPLHEPQLNWESDEFEWTSPAEILKRPVVPDLWKSYESIAPTLEDVRSDTVHGSAYVSLRALEVLRDRAATLRAIGDADHGAVRRPGVPGPDSFEELRDLAERLISARASMAAVHNRINRVMHQAGDVRSVERQAERVLREAPSRDRRASENAVKLLLACRPGNVEPGRSRATTVLTLSRSGTVTAALAEARPRVLVAVSEPGREGIAVAEELAGMGCQVTLIPDASVAASPAFDLVLVGADTLLPDGAVYNKVGTHTTALVAHERSVPFYVAASIDKILAVGEPALELAPASSVYHGHAPLDVLSVIFERTPADLITGYVTDGGVLSASEIAEAAKVLREMEAWRTR